FGGGTICTCNKVCTCIPVYRRSDRAAKTNVGVVDCQAVLEKVAELPLQTWHYIDQEPGVRHIGPMAQDFAAAFGVGKDDKTIHSLDADGVALAAIQGLYALVQKQSARIQKLVDTNAALMERLGALEGRTARNLAPQRHMAKLV